MAGSRRLSGCLRSPKGRTMTTEFREVDPRTLIPNPNNPRTSPPNEERDRRFALNIQIVGVLQPPVVREQADGTLMILYGHRRVRCSIMAKLKVIPVIVRSGDEKLDDLAAGSENMIREDMSLPDQWRYVDRMRREKNYTERQLCKALMVTPAYLKRLSLLAGLHPPILDAIEIDYGPDERALRVIARTPADEQRAAWAEIWSETIADDADPAEYRMTEDEAKDFDWTDFAHALEHTQFFARDASFDDVLARKHGIAWEEDLFAEGGQDNRYTVDRERYASAQRAWIEGQLGEDDVLLATNEYGQPMMEDGMRRLWHAKEGPRAFYLDSRTLKVGCVFLERWTPQPGAGAAMGASAPAPKVRSDISGTGEKMIGQIRTHALHSALDAACATAEPWDLVGALLLAFCGDNIAVQGDPTGGFGKPSARNAATAALFPEGVLVRDPELLRTHTMAVLRSVANCDVSLHSGSGIAAQLLGVLFDADVQMPNMAFDEFLKTFSKAGITTAVEAEGLAAQSTGKLMRAALIAHVGEGRWVPEAAGFAQSTATWKAKLAKDAHHAARLAVHAEDDDGDQDEEPSDADDGEDLVSAEDETASEDPNAACVSAAAEIDGAGEAFDAVAGRLRDEFASTPEARAHFDSHVMFVRAA